MKLHVAVGVVLNANGQVLVARRPDHVHLGGLWEFPGGKREPGETIQQALARELKEEIGITVQQASSLCQITHHYEEKMVLLDVWRVEGYLGEPLGQEGQQIQWMDPDALSSLPIPKANIGIVAALQSSLAD